MEKNAGLILWFLCALTIGGPTGASAAIESPSGGPDSLAGRRKMVAAEIARLTESDHPDRTGEDPSDASERLTNLRSLDSIYARQQKLLDEQRDLELKAKQSAADLAALDQFGLDEPKPYSFLLAEDLADSLAVETDRESVIKADLKAAKSLLRSAHQALDSNESEASFAEHSPADAQLAKQHSAAEELSAADLPQTLLRAQVSLRQAAVELQTDRLEVCQSRQKLLNAKIKLVSKDVKFTVQDRDKQLDRLKEAEFALKRQRKAAEARFAAIDAAMLRAADHSSDPTTASPLGRPAGDDDAIDARRAAQEADQAELLLLEQRLENIASLRGLWRQRFNLASSNTIEHSRLTQWQTDLDDFIDQLKDMSLTLDQRREGVRAKLAVHPLSNAPQNEETEQAVELRHAALVSLRDTVEDALDDIHAVMPGLQRFRSELKERVKQSTGWGTSLGGTWRAIATYEVANVNSQSITVTKIFILIAYICAGILLAYAVSRLLGRRMLTKMGMHQGTVTALKSIVFYGLCVVFGVLSFQLLQVPLAAFAFLGGAAAIAIGFGSQDIMNNFMSGIILLVEQPIRVGDVVQLSSVQGIVQHIGLRSTRLETELNHELIVPNKALLDDQVTNLTLSDAIVQTFVTVTIERYEDIRKAKDQMLKIAFLHPLVVKSPRPVVLLKESDTYWLSFEVHFSVEHGSFMKCAIVQSEILEQISALYMPPVPDDAKQDASEPADVTASESSPAEAPANGVAVAVVADREADLPAASPAGELTLSQMKKITNAAVAKGLKGTRGAVKIK